MKRWAAALRFSGVGWYVGLCIAGGVGLGLWLDGVTHTRPLLTLIGLGFGVFLAFFGLYRTVLPLPRQGRHRENK